MLYQSYAVLGFVVSLSLIFVAMPGYIDYLKKFNASQNVSEYALEEYKKKAKTPIMGGLLFVLIPAVVFVFISFKALTPEILFVYFSYFLFSVVGFIDDMLIIARHDNEGLSPKTKLIAEFVIVVILYLIFRDRLSCFGVIDVPFMKADIRLDDIVFLAFMIVMYLGEANAVNFTDGMDGLCAGVSIIVSIGFIIISVITGHYQLVVLLSSILGGLIGYLCFNWHPAKIFMGDSGSLALGALFASLAVVLQKEIALLVLGGVFLLEMICVVIQQLAVRIFHKRVFSYTPIHYAFQIKGYKETKIVKGFYVAALIFVIIGTYLGIR